jgi:hypothetical protein
MQQVNRIERNKRVFIIWELIVALKEVKAK